MTNYDITRNTEKLRALALERGARIERLEANNQKLRGAIQGLSEKTLQYMPRRDFLALQDALAVDDAGGGEPERMAITIQRAPRCLWHSDCDTGEIKGNGIMKEVERDDEEGVTLLECLHCGRKGYVPHGTEFDMPVCVDVVGGSSADDGASPQHRDALEAFNRIMDRIPDSHFKGDAIMQMANDEQAVRHALTNTDHDPQMRLGE